METLKLRFELTSAATFGRGDGVAGLVDREVEHDADGLPYLRGRALKGLLAEEGANLLYALDIQGKGSDWWPVAETLFGRPGSTLADRGLLRVGDARLPKQLRDAVAYALAGEDAQLTPDKVLESLTSIRRQTSMSPSGAPEHGSLRATRVILPGIVFESELRFHGEPDHQALALLAACVLALRRAGTARNRGRGRLRAWLCDGETDVTETYFKGFVQGVRK